MILSFILSLLSVKVVTADLVPTPDGALRGNINYFFTADSGSFNNFQVTVNVETDIMVSDLNSGISFQLNCVSNNQVSIFQQFGWGCGGDDFNLASLVNNWDSSGNLVVQQGNNDDISQFLGIIPAGSSFSMELVSDSNNNVNGATLTASLGGEPFTDTFSWDSPVTPVYGCSLVIVGVGNGATAQLAQGSGTIVYSSSSTTFYTDGDLSSEQGSVTVENGNSVYGQVDGSHQNQISQDWGVAS